MATKTAPLIPQRMDFSPIARGGEAMGAGIAQAGQAIGTAVNQFRMKQAQKEQMEGATAALQKFGYSPEEAKAAAKAVGPEKIGNMIAQLELADRRFSQVMQQNQQSQQAIALALENNYMAQSQEAAEQGEAPQIDWENAAQDAIQFGASPQAVRAWLDIAEATGAKEPEAQEITTKPVDGTNYKIIMRNGQYANTVPIKDSEEPKDMEPQAVYDKRVEALDKAKANGTLSDEEYNSAVASLKEEVFGAQQPRQMGPMDLLLQDLANRQGISGGEWSIEE